MILTVEDRTAIHDLLARYCWHIDQGEGDAWADLWCDDGSFTGIPEPLQGREALRQMPGGFHAMFSGKLRHHITNAVVEAGSAADEARVRAYSTLSDWRSGGALLSFAKANFVMRKIAGHWRIQSLHAQIS